MINIRARRISERDLLAFTNELAAELGGNGQDGRAFGIEKNKDGTETIWLFGKKLQTITQEA